MPDAAAPPLRKLLREGPALAKLLLSQWRKPPFDPGRCEAGRPVLVIPGFLANDASTGLLRRTLRAAGHRAYGWGMGVNLGARADTLDRLGERLDAVIAKAGRPVALIGWSLGGLYARELAKRRADDVDLVITLGSPFSGDLRANHARRLYELINDHKVDDPPVEVELGRKPLARTVSFWSERDGIVATSCARGSPGETDECIELHCTHMGFVTDAEPLRAILELLAS